MRKPYRRVITFYRLLKANGTLLGDTYHTMLTCFHLVRSNRRMRTDKSADPVGEKCDNCMASEASIWMKGQGR